MQKAQVVELPIEFELNSEGKIKGKSVKNVVIALERDKNLRGVLAWNQFTHEVDVVKDSPELMIEKGPMRDEYIAAIIYYLEDKFHILFSENLIQLAIKKVSRIHAYNPVTDYLEECYKNWDKEKRVDYFLPTYLGADKSEVTTFITKMFFTGAVAKAYKKNVKFDYVLDLVGGQGVGKTTLLTKMAHGWYTDQFTDLKNKDNYAIMLSSLIINDDEMTATKNSSFEDLKKFISATELTYRAPYARYAVKRPKSFVVARTTNELTYLRDKTGERRFMPVMAHKSQQVYSPVTDLSEEQVAQLWGEFVHYYKSGDYDFYINDEMNAKIEEHRKEFMYIDTVEDEIDHVLQTSTADFLTSKDIARQMGEADLVKNRTLAKKIKYVMDNHPQWEPGFKLKNGVSQRGYRKR